MDRSAPLPPAPQRPALRPGVRVVRRDDRHLQIGIDPPHRLVVEDQPDVRRLLDDIRAGRSPAPETPLGREVVAQLVARQLIVDGTQLHAALAGAVDRGAAAAAFAQFGAQAPDRLAARAAARVVIEAAPDLHDQAARLLRAQGAAATDGGTPTVVLVVDTGELRRDRIDPWVRGGHPHLVVVGGPAGLTLGPFVVPGLTACLRCVDAHLGHDDPRRATVVEQAAHEPEPTAAAPRDPALVSLALAWAVRDIVSYLDGDLPATWSTTVRLRPDLTLERRTWTRHPHCGCSWGEAR